MNYLYLFLLILVAGCNRADFSNEPLAAIQIQDRNGLTETVSSTDKLKNYNAIDFLSPQPYQKVLRIYRSLGKNRSKITTYHPNGAVWQYLEAEDLRAFGKYKEWHANGQLHIEANVIGGTADVSLDAQRDWLFDGTSRVYNDAGTLIAHMPYSHGSLEGVSFYFDSSGGLEREIPYQGNLLEGFAIEYYQTHKIHTKTAYHKGKKEGISLGFFTNGQTAWEEEYRDNLLINGSYYNTQGELLSTVDDGTGVRALFEGDTLSVLMQVQQGFVEGKIKHLTPQGELKTSYSIKDGRKHGVETIYFLKSERDKNSDPNLLQPKITIDWEEQSVHGTVKTWYPTGQLQSQKEFCHNKKTGPAMGWYRNGSLMFVEEYEHDKLTKGLYYKKNALDTTSCVVQGTGVATIYDENGIFLRKISYTKGEPSDPD